MRSSIVSTKSLRKYLRTIGLKNDSVQIVISQDRFAARVYCSTGRQYRIAEGHITGILRHTKIALAAMHETYWFDNINMVQIYREGKPC